MSSIHYKFRSSLEYDTLTFDGPSISLNDLRDAIIQQKKIGKSSDFTLEVTNAQTKEVYHDPTMQVPRNTSVVVKRIPVARLAAVTGKIIDPEAKEDQDSAKVSLEKLSQTGDLANANASEDDKIAAMMHQSGEQFQPDQYVSKIRPGGYICFRCGQPGHFIRNCPTIGDPRFNNTQRFNRVAATEYYIMQMKERERLALLKAPVTSNRSYSPVVSSDAHSAKSVPVELQCPMCKKLLHDAVLIPCCGTSYCDECIRNYLIDNDFACPSCKEKTSPDNLVANKSLRQAVENFKKSEHLASSSASTSQPGTTVNNATAVLKTENVAPLVEAKPKISITLLKKKEPTPTEQKSTESKGEAATSDDILNSSAGPTTEAQLFEDIAKETELKAESDEAAKEKKVAEDASVAPTQLPDATVVAPVTTNETAVIPGSLPQTQLPIPGQGVMSNVVASTTLTQPVIHSAAALQLQQQTQIVAQQIQLQQQQLQLQQLRQQQQQLGLQQARLQQAEASQLQPGLVVAAQPQIVPQQVRPSMASMAMTSSINPALTAQQVIVSGPQVVDPALQVAAAPVVQQRLITGGIVTPLNPVANVAPVVVRHVQPAVGLSMSTAFAPDSVHSVVPARLPSRLLRTGAGRDAGSFSLIDPLFDLASKDSTALPMSEEEFYRAKIKLKDSGGKPHSRSRSRSKERSRTERYTAKDFRSRRRDRSRSYERKDRHDRHDSKDRFKENDRHMSRDRHDSRDRHSSKERHNARKRTDKSSRREKYQDSKRSPRPEEVLQRKRKDKLNELVKGYDSLDELERELVDDHKSKKRRLHASPSSSRTRKPSPINSLRIDPKRTASRNTSTGSWSRSPTPVARDIPPVKKRETTSFSGDEFETIKLEDSDGKTKRHRSRSSKKSHDDDAKNGIKIEREIRKRKSDEGEIGRGLKIKKSRKGDVLLDDRMDNVITTETDFSDEKQIKEEFKKRESRKESKEKSKAKKARKEKGKKHKQKSSTEKSSQESTELTDLTDDSEGWDVILSKKNKKIIAKELEKKARKEKKSKSKGVKKTKERVKASVVEIKTTKPIVDFSSSQTESEFEIRARGSAIEGQEVAEEHVPIWAASTVQESFESPDVQRSPVCKEQIGESEVEMTDNRISEAATLSAVPVEKNKPHDVECANKEGIVASLDVQLQSDQGDEALQTEVKAVVDESASTAVKANAELVVSVSNIEVSNLPRTSDAIIDTQVSAQAAAISDQKQTGEVKVTEEPSDASKDIADQGCPNKGESSESEQLASLFASIDEVLNEPKAGSPEGESHVATANVTSEVVSVQESPKLTMDPGVELVVTEEQDKVASEEERDDVVMTSEKVQGDNGNLTEVEMKDFVVTCVLEETMNIVDARVSVAELQHVENKDLNTEDVTMSTEIDTENAPVNTEIVPNKEKDSDEGTSTGVTENESESVAQNETEAAVDIPSEKQNIIDSSEKLKVNFTEQDTGAATEQVSSTATLSVDAKEKSKETALGWREEKGYSSESSTNAEAAEAETNSSEEGEEAEEGEIDAQHSEDEEADSSEDEDVSVEEDAAEEEMEAAGRASSAEGEDSNEEGTGEEEGEEVDGSDSEVAASDADDATDESDEEGREVSEAEQESEVEEHVSAEKTEIGNKAVAVSLVNGNDYSTDKSGLESDSESERKRAKKKKKRKEKHRREKERKRRKKKKKHSDELTDDEFDEVESDDEKERQRRKRKRAEKKAKKQKRKHKKHKHNKKHRKSKKHGDDSDDEFLDDDVIEPGTEHKKKRKKSKSTEHELGGEVSAKHSKASRSKTSSSKSRNVENNANNDGGILVVNANDSRLQHSRKHESRTVFVERDLRDDIRRIEARKKIKVSRTVRT